MTKGEDVLYPGEIVGDEDSAGRRLEATVRAAMSQIKGMNFSRLARESGVSRGTFYLWFTNQQHPTTWTLGRVAKVLDVPVRDLWDVWEGREAVPPSTEQAIMRLIERMDEHDERIAELVAELKALADGSITSAVGETLKQRTSRVQRWGESEAERVESTRRRRPSAVPEGPPER